ncbi:hypothetical protein KIPB_014817, partial [Kipferlia bialata]
RDPASLLDDLGVVVTYMHLSRKESRAWTDDDPVTATLTRVLLRILANGIRVSIRGEPQLWDLFRKVPRLVTNPAVSQTLAYGLKTCKKEYKADVQRYVGFLRFMVSNKLISEGVSALTSRKAAVTL